MKADEEEEEEELVIVIVSDEMDEEEKEEEEEEDEELFEAANCWLFSLIIKEDWELIKEEADEEDGDD
jgi:hypothetical protein